MPDSMNTPHQPHVLVLGGNFAGLASAQEVRRLCGDGVRITLIDRRDYLLFVPNISADVFENRNPADHQIVQLRPILEKGRIDFIEAEITTIDVDGKTVGFVPNDRPGEEGNTLSYDYLVIALGSRLSFDRIEGFAEHGHTVSDLYHGERLRKHLHDGGYKGGTVAIGSARFHQGNGAAGLQPYPGGSIPNALAACEGPPLEIAMSMATWMGEHKRGGPDRITLFTPGETIAEDAGMNIVTKFLSLAGGMGMHYKNNVQDVVKLTATTIEFANGESIEAELKILLPDWVAHDCLRSLPIADDQGFIVTDLLMRNPTYRTVFAAGDCAAVTVPKLGAIGHQEAEIVAMQIAADLGHMTRDAADKPLQPVVMCIGDMGAGKAFYIRSNVWFGGEDEVLEIGRVPYQLKMRYRDMFIAGSGRIPPIGMLVAQFAVEHIKV
ncbi:NAD(P)/FAD-dependent oxidoreductase [Acidiphilium sp.]|uniref:NAD(P)/FAD-dependent oxidoreductase n=1 Tax=Acidiphilium sp. TaxID=527 RepID=UPI003D09573B